MLKNDVAFMYMLAITNTVTGFMIQLFQKLKRKVEAKFKQSQICANIFQKY